MSRPAAASSTKRERISASFRFVETAGDRIAVMCQRSVNNWKEVVKRCDMQLGGASPEEALSVFDAQIAQHRDVFSRFDSLGDRLALQRTRQRHVSTQRFDPLAVPRQPSDAALVDLEDIRLEQDKALQTTVAEADIVDSDQDARLPQ